MSRQTFRDVRAHKFEGKPPNGLPSWQAFAEQIPVYESVDKALLYQGDDTPFHIVLDIAQEGAVSANGLLYDAALMNAMEEQLPGLGGLRGHLEDGQWSAYPIETVDWVGHQRVGDTLYAKGYIAPGPDREALRRAKARGAELRTSLDVQAYQEVVDQKKGTYRLREIDFFTIDLVHGKKAALRKSQSGQAMITRETENQEEHMPADAEATTETTAHITVNLSEVEGLRTQIQTAETERNTAQEALLVSQQEARRYAAVVGTIRVNLGYGDDVSDDELTAKLSEMYGVFNRLAEHLGNDVSIDVAVAELLSFKQETVQREAERRIDMLVSRFTENWHVTSEDNKTKIAKLNKSFKRALQAETATDGETLEALAERVWKEDFQMMADSILQAIGGPAAVVTGMNQQETDKNALSDEELKDARRFLPGR